MQKNLGNVDRALRGLAAASALACVVLAPFSLTIRLALFGTTSLYLFFTALAGTCVGYRLMGKSTCPTSQRA